MSQACIGAAGCARSSTAESRPTPRSGTAPRSTPRSAPASTSPGQQGWRVVEAIRDAASGFTLDRPGIERVRQLLRDGAADVVLAYAVDRLSRNQNQIGVLFDEIRAGRRAAGVRDREVRGHRRRQLHPGGAGLRRRGRAREDGRADDPRQARAGALGPHPAGVRPGLLRLRRTTRPPASARSSRSRPRSSAGSSPATPSSAASTASAHELNESGITTFDGGRWYPIGVKRVLQNESYAGRLVYRRTRWIKVRGKDGKMHRKHVERPAEEHVEIPGASPRIVDEALWQRVQQIINDPERIARRPKLRHEYPLRGRMKCGLCGSAMVGQTMINRGHTVPLLRLPRRLRSPDRPDVLGAQRPRRSAGAGDLARDPREAHQPGGHPPGAAAAAAGAGPGGGRPPRAAELGRIGERERRLVKLYSVRRDRRAPGAVASSTSSSSSGRSSRRAYARYVRTGRRPRPLPDAGLFERACERSVTSWTTPAPRIARSRWRRSRSPSAPPRRRRRSTGVVPIDTDVYCHTNVMPMHVAR